MSPWRLTGDRRRRTGNHEDRDRDDTEATPARTTRAQASGANVLELPLTYCSFRHQGILAPRPRTAGYPAGDQADSRLRGSNNTMSPGGAFEAAMRSRPVDFAR